MQDSGRRREHERIDAGAERRGIDHHDIEAPLEDIDQVLHPRGPQQLGALAAARSAGNDHQVGMG